MTMLLFSKHCKPLGRHESPDKYGTGEPPAVVRYDGRAFIWKVTTAMGFYQYVEADTYDIAVGQLRPAPPPFVR